MVERTLHLVDDSGVMDILAPDPPAGQRGRKGSIRENTRLWAIGVILCTRLGHETTIKGVHEVLSEALPRDLQWELGVLRPLTTAHTAEDRGFDPEEARLTKNGKPRKEIWVEDGYERLGYDDLVNVVSKLRRRLDYGHGSAPDLDDDEHDTGDDERGVRQVVDLVGGGPLRLERGLLRVRRARRCGQSDQRDQADQSSARRGQSGLA